MIHSFKQPALWRRKNEQGFLLMDLLVWGMAVTIIGGGLLFAFSQFNKHQDARVAGAYVGVVLDALQAKLVNEARSVEVGNDLTIDILKGPECGASSRSTDTYLPTCDFPDTTEFGLGVSIDIIRDAATGDFRAELETTPLNPAMAGGTGADILGEMTAVINGGAFEASTFDTTNNFHARTDLARRVVFATIASRPNQDPFQRRDGNNTPSNDWDFGTYSITGLGRLSGGDNPDSENVINRNNIEEKLNDGEIRFSRLVDADTNINLLPLSTEENAEPISGQFVVDPSGTSRMNKVIVEDDIFIEPIGGFLTDHIVHGRFLVGQGANIPFPRCRASSVPELRGSLVGIVGETNGKVPSVNPSPIRGFTVFANRDDATTSWQVFAGVFVRKGAGKEKLFLPPTELVQIQVQTFCRPGDTELALN